MNEQWAGKVAIVTGASTGMGLATARAFAEAGAWVVLSDIDVERGELAAESLRQSGRQAVFTPCDVTSEDEVASMIGSTVDRFGRLDAAFNNAGIMLALDELPDVSTAAYQKTLAVNLDGVWHCMKHELLQMRRQGSGAIVNNSSVGGLVGNAGRAAYHAAKHAVLGLTKSAALEFAPSGIRINAVCPGAIDTPLLRDLMRREHLDEADFTREQPIGRLGLPEEVATAVVWLCGPGASFIVGHALPVDGGYTVH